MSQPDSIHVPTAAGGPCTPDAFAGDINDTIDALISSHGGTSRPDYAVEGTIWIDQVSSELRHIYIFDGAQDVLIANYNPTTHALTLLNIPDAAIDLDKLEADIFDALAETTPDTGDYLIGIDASDSNKTKRFSLDDILASAAASFPAGSMMLFGGPSAPAGWAICDGSLWSRDDYADLFAAIGTTWGAGDGSTTFNIPDARGKTAIGAGDGSVSEKVTFTNVSVAGDTFTVGSNVDKWSQGQRVQLTTTGGLPAPLATGTDYFIIRSSATTFKLATSLANAVAGTAINITTQGTGTHTVTTILSSRTLGENGGEETHGLSGTEMPAHAHSQDVLNGTGGTRGWNSGTAASIVNGSTGTAGGSAAHNNMQPYLVLNYIIKL